MKLGKTVLVVGLVAMCVVMVASQAAAQGTTASPKQLLDEAKRLYAAHDYAGALKRLQQVDRAKLGFFEKGDYASRLESTQKAIEGKAADEKAFGEGREALTNKRYATAIAKLSQAADSEYLEDEKSGPAKGLLQLALDDNRKAADKAVGMLDQAKVALKDGKTADARKIVDDVKAMDLRLGMMERNTLADLEKRLAAADAPKVAAAKPAAPMPVMKAPMVVAQAETKPAAKPAAKPAETKAAAPAKPAGPSAKDVMAEAKKAYEAKNYDLARSKLKSIDTKQLGFFDKAFGYDPLLSKVEKAQAEAKKAAEKPVVAAKPAETKPVAKPAETKAVAVVAKPAEKPVAVAAKPAEKPVVMAAKPAETKPAPKVPAGPTASQQVAEAQKLYDAGNFDVALKALQKVDRGQLGFFEKMGYDGLVGKCQKAIPAKAADEKALADGKSDLAAKRYGPATEKLSQAASSGYLEADKREAAKGLLVTAKADNQKAVDHAKALIAQGNAALKDGKTAQASKLAAEAKAMNADLGAWDRMALSSLEKKAAEAAQDEKVAAAKAAEKKAVAEKLAAAKPAEKPVAKPLVMKPVEKPAAKVAEVKVAEATKPVAKTAPKIEAAPAEVKPVVKASAETKVMETKPVKAAPAPTLTIAQQARQAQSEDEVKLGQDAAQQFEYEKAKIHFQKAMSLCPENAAAKKGLNEAMRFLAEREEPLGDMARDVRALERQRTLAGVQEMLAQAEREMARAERPEDYTEALRPLAQADRTIEVARVLSAEEQERLREEVYVLRKSIQARKAEAEAVRSKRAVDEAGTRETQRRRTDEQDRQNKVRQLWERATELRKSMQFGEAIEVLDRLVAIDPNDERAMRWREDLLYLEAQARQVRVRQTREDGAVEAITDTEEAAIHPGEKVRGETKYLRYPQPKDWKQLTEYRREFTKAVSAEPKAVSETRRRLSEEIDLDFEKTSLDNVLKYISEVQRGLNIVIDPDVATAGIDLTTRVVDLKVKQVSVESVLSLILGSDLGYRVESGYLLVTTKEKLQQNLPAVTYPVQDLLAQIPDFSDQAPRFDIASVIQAAAQSGQGGGGAGNLFGGNTQAVTPEVQLGPTEVMDMVQRIVNAQSNPSVAVWSAEGGPATIEYFNGVFIVTQTRNGHEKVSDLLEQLRRERAIMISVESRFCEVSDQFLQDITLDVDVAFLNAGRFASGANPIQDPNAQVPYDTTPGKQGFQKPILWEVDRTTTPPTLLVDVYGNPVGRIPTDPNLVDAFRPGGSYGQPIMVSSTGSNGAGTSSLLPLAGTAFANFTANEGGMAFSGVFLDELQLGFLLRAIQSDIRSTTLQAPRLTLYNGQRSYISVSTVVTYIADAEPVVAEFAVGWDLQIGAVPVGVTLDVKATVSADRRYVQMDLRPQSAALGTPAFQTYQVEAAAGLAVAAFTIELPRVMVQDFKTTVSVPDGGTLLLGGTRKFTESEAETGVPILSKIPILKRLFNNRASLRTASNLLILICPKIIIQAEEEKILGYDNF